MPMSDDPPKTGLCYCGCGGKTDGYWVRGHDRRAELALFELVYGRSTITNVVWMMGYGPSKSIVEAANAAMKVKWPWRR